MARKTAAGNVGTTIGLLLPPAVMLWAAAELWFSVLAVLLAVFAILRIGYFTYKACGTSNEAAR